MKIRFSLVLLGLASASVGSIGHSETLEEYADKCKQELEIDRIPGYQCSDGIELTNFESTNLIIPPRGKVTLGRVPTSNPDVDAVFLCRDIKTNGTTVLDGYILQNRKTGKACFFDKKANSPVVAPPIDFSTAAAASLANANWHSPATLDGGGPCLDCHNNDAFILGESLARAASELGLVGVDRPISGLYSIVETIVNSPLQNGNNKIKTNLSTGPGNCAQSCHTLSGRYSSFIDGMPPLAGSFFTSWPAGQLMHMDSSMCVHPLYGTANENTNAVLWPTCDYEDRLTFEFTPDGHLQEKASNKCLNVASNVVNQNVVFKSNCNASTKFMVTSQGQLNVQSTNLCVEPEVSTRTNDTELVLKTCTSSVNQKFTSISIAEKAVVQTSTNRCWRTEDSSPYPASNKRNVVLSSSCNDESSSFALLDNGMIKHIPSGYCVHPEGGTAEQFDNFVLFNSCDYEPGLEFEVTKYGSIKHKQTGLCAHPYLDGTGEGTEVIFWPSCNDGTEDRLRYVFESK